ncbi:MAG TPA: gliding motility-associated C-terminal domain-containing protein, partial [Chitinophagales bacterium]|nr:gliding motility-associated C-terminal domain-containing protein [Chitinophagales bacterium]
TTGAIVQITTALSVANSVHNISCTGTENGSINLSVSGGSPGYSYQWDNGSTGSSISNLSQGSYTVTITDIHNCRVTQNYTVGVDYNLQVHIDAATTISTGQAIPLVANTTSNHDNTYTWSPTDNLTCTDCQSTNAVPTETTLYTVWVTDANGCKATDTITLNVLKGATDIFVPNAFSPNGDGNNDYFEVYGDMGAVSFFEVSVFDRWGEKVFESNDYRFKWDGTYKGEPAQIGNYVYVITAAFLNGSHKNYKGSVTLLR